MANAVLRLPLSGSTEGRGILVAATATPGTTVHTTGVGVTPQDEVWLYCVNSDTSARKLTIEWGGVTAPNDLIEVPVPAESGLLLVIPGLVLVGSGTVANLVRAFAATANVLSVHGYVLRLTP